MNYDGLGLPCVNASFVVHEIISHLIGKTDWVVIGYSIHHFHLFIL